MRWRRVWVLVALLAFVLLDLAALYFVPTYRPICQGMSEGEVVRALGTPVEADGGSREDVLIFREGSEWTGCRVTWTSFCRNESGEMRLYDWGTRLAPPDWVSSMFRPAP